MPTYHYRSEPAIFLKDVDTNLLKDFQLYIENPDDFGGSRLIWVVKHTMDEKVDIKCPITNNPAIKTMIGINSPIFYTKGDGIVKDISGARRDMNLHTLVNNDPYPSLREPGEADDLAHRLRNGGKYNPKTQYFTPK